MGRRALIIFILFAVLAAGVFFLFAYMSPMEGLLSCSRFKDVDQFRGCIKGTLPAAMQAAGAQRILRTFAAEFTPSRCHDAGHLVGQELYARSTSIEAALSQCSFECASACTHGAAGAALASVPEIRDSFGDLPHLDESMLSRLGAAVCTGRESCHGVGHILLQLFKDLQVALKWCDAIAKEKEPWACYRGVFMENASFDSTHVIFEEARVSNVRDPDNFLYPCTAVEERYQPACLHNIHMNQSITLSERGINDRDERARLITEACEQASNRMQPPCYEGVGSYLALNSYPVSNVMERCLALDNISNAAGCVFGFAYALSAWGQTDNALAVCAAIEDGRLKYTCYESVADDLSVRPSRSVETMCDGTEDEECKRAAEYVLSVPDTLSVLR
jgi:hypothetical protein